MVFALLGGKFPALAGFECNVIFLLIFKNKRLRMYIVVIPEPSGIHKRGRVVQQADGSIC